MCTEVPFPDEALAGICPGVSNEIGDGFDRQNRRHHHDVGQTHDAGDRNGVANKIKREFLVERGADRVVSPHEQQRVTVWQRIDHRLGAKIAAHAAAVLDHELLAEIA
jgi:hypothetical protein